MGAAAPTRLTDVSMDRHDRKIRLGYSMRGLGYHASAWRDPEVPSDGAMSIDYYVDVARTAQRGLFDMVFLADQNAIRLNNTPKGVLGRTAIGAELEPLTLLAALSRETQNIGLAATASTTFHAPYQLARQFSSLDHLSGGRVAWNVVTSSRDEEARNFSGDKIPDKDERYERAAESVDIAFGLWDSWDDDAFTRNKQTGVFFDPEKLHVLNHVGKHFRVQGPLNLPRTPQGRPIIIQAGASPGGMGLAARIADVVYTVQTSIEEAKAFYAGVRALIEKAGRSPDHVRIMPGFLPIIGTSQQHAQDRYQKMKEEVDPLIGLQHLAPYFGDLSGYDLDGPVPELRTDRPVISRGETQLRMARRNNWSIRQLFQQTTIGNAHHVIVGTAKEIADKMEEWFFGGAADGFNILPWKSPMAIREFVAEVTPELQRRGLFRTAYEATTLRENLGLPPLHSRYATP
jgi:alkanesulfonate monooxygenase